MALSKAHRSRPHPTEAILLLGLALFLVAAHAQAPVQAAQPQHIEQRGGESPSGPVDTPHITPLETMIRVPVVNGVALVQDIHAEGTDQVRTTGPWVELDHQDELDAMKNDPMNDPQQYSYTTEPEAGEQKLDKAPKQEPVPDKILVSSANVPDSHSGSDITKKHHPAWLDFMGMESDLGVLVAFKATEADVEEQEEKSKADAEEKEKEKEKESEVKAAEEADKEEEAKNFHQPWLDLFSMDSDMGTLTAYKAAKDAPAASESKQQSTLDVPEAVNAHATDHQVDAAVDEGARSQGSTSTPLAQADRQHTQMDDDEETDHEDDINAKNVCASIDGRTPLNSQAVLKNRLNKNDEHFDNDKALSDRELEIRKGAIRLGKHHHHHITSKKMSELESEQYTLHQPQQDAQEHEPQLEGARSKILLETGAGESSSPPPLVIPDNILHRGLVPSVQGAHHCVPQFCVNTTLSPDGRFVTFHIERDLAATGWISLGIGYAMTMADLIILWPNPTSDHPRGAVLSRRTSHAYVEPQLVGHAHPARDGIKADSVSEADLYPANEYILHNTVAPKAAPKAATAMAVFPDAHKFVVQFTRPVRTRNRAFKLTPGQEQDFCWAYSPKPISADAVGDPGAHIAQHASVGSFAMDVGANQPQLKEVLAQLRKEDEQEEAEEKARKAKDLEESNKKLADEEAAANGGWGEGGQKEEGAPGQLAGKSSSASAFALQGLSCLTALAVLYLFR